MARDQTNRIKPKELGKDISTNDALKNIAGYAPVNTQCTVANIHIAYDAMVLAQAVETQAEAALRTARDNAVAAEWGFHNLILSSKDQVKAQFGKDSNELQALGLKKTTEYKKSAAKRDTTAKSKT